jgi:rhomboid family GlyGly-CTERM serine protease
LHRIGKAPWAWTGLAAFMATGALAAWFSGPLLHHLWDWQPSLALSEPWRAWTAAFIHYSHQHLAANLAGLVLVTALGWTARVPLRAMLAWSLAWPLTQSGLCLQPALLHFGGLSGVLHAGVAVIAVHLLACGERPQRWIGAAILVLLCAKVLGETPWGEPLRHPASWDIAIAPLSHATGLAAGLLCAGLTEIWHRRQAAKPAP